MNAALNLNVDVVRILSEYEAGFRNEDGLTALMHACNKYSNYEKDRIK